MKLRLGSTDLSRFQVIEERSLEVGKLMVRSYREGGDPADQALPPRLLDAALPHADPILTVWQGTALTATYPGIRSKTLSGCPRPWIVLNPVHTAVSYTNGRVVYTG